jgi:hypothetical protein
VNDVIHTSTKVNSHPVFNSKLFFLFFKIKEVELEMIFW